MSFTDDLAKEADNAILAAQEVHRVTAIQLFSAVILSTPVGNPDLWQSEYIPVGYTGGSARANWQLSFDQPIDSTTSNTDDGSSTANNIARKINSGKARDQYILSNNLPYINRLENGWSTQAPTGMVAKNAIRIRAQIPNFERAANKKYGVKN